MPRVALFCALLIALAAFALQDQNKSSPPKLPPPIDIDPALTEQFRQTEKQFCDAIVGKSAQVLENLVGEGYTLRIADIPESSLPRAIWMDNTLNRLKAESCDQSHLAARKLADEFAAVSVVWSTKGTTDGRDFSGNFYVVDFWKKSSGKWHIIARYSTPLAKPPDRGSRKPPPATDIDPQLTEQLRQFEQQLGEAAMHRDTTVLERLVGSEYSLRLGDAPELSVPRTVWIDNSRPQAPHPYRLESLEEHYHAARKLNDNLAVVSFLLTQKASVDGVDRSGDFYEVDIWKKTEGKWQIIARYSTPVPKTTGTSTAIPK
jgi:hypothetical protein